MAEPTIAAGHKPPYWHSSLKLTTDECIPCRMTILCYVSQKKIVCFHFSIHDSIFAKHVICYCPSVWLIVCFICLSHGWISQKLW